jgi:hypothetical protein
MIPLLTMPRWPFIAAICAALVFGALAYRGHVYDSGVAAESTRRDAIDAHNSLAATQARDDLNARIRVLQSMLDTARAQVEQIKKELDDANQISTQRQSDLLAGRAHERVLVDATCAASKISPDGQAPGGTAGAVDSGSGIEVDLNPRVASWLERVRADHNAAVERLDACIQQYDAVKAAADAMP